MKIFPLIMDFTRYSSYGILLEDVSFFFGMNMSMFQNYWTPKTEIPLNLIPSFCSPNLYPDPFSESAWKPNESATSIRRLEMMLRNGVASKKS